MDNRATNQEPSSGIFLPFVKSTPYRAMAFDKKPGSIIQRQKQTHSEISILLFLIVSFPQCPSNLQQTQYNTHYSQNTVRKVGKLNQ